MLKLQNYTVTADKKSILKDLTHAFETGKVHVVMGPNGSGKSTLALSLAGAPHFESSDESSARLNNTELLPLKTHERAQHGLFVSYQTPPSLSGVTVFGLLRTALHGSKSASDIKKDIEETAQTLNLSKELLSRSLNDGFSGGERKKMELLQMKVLDPTVAILDEIDTGVDRDALKTMTHFLSNWSTKDKTLIVITHRTQLAEELQADTVSILKDGSLVVTGDRLLAQRIEKEGYSTIKNL